MYFFYTRAQEIRSRFVFFFFFPFLYYYYFRALSLSLSVKRQIKTTTSDSTVVYNIMPQHLLWKISLVFPPPILNLYYIYRTSLYTAVEMIRIWLPVPVMCSSRRRILLLLLYIYYITCKPYRCVPPTRLLRPFRHISCMVISRAINRFLSCFRSISPALPARPRSPLPRY